MSMHMLPGLRLGGLLVILKEVGARALPVLELSQWTATEQDLLDLFEFRSTDPDMQRAEEKSWRNFKYWLKNIVSKYQL